MRNTLFIVLGVTALALAGCQGTTRASRSSDTGAPAVAPPEEMFSGKHEADLSTDEKVATYNREIVDEDRMVCRKETITGSHFQRTVCRTIKQIREDQAHGVDAVRSHQGKGTVVGE